MGTSAALVLLALASVPQEEVTLRHRVEERGLYVAPVRQLETIGTLLKDDPAEAERLLDRIIEFCTEKSLEHVEKRLRIEVKSLEYYPSSGFADFLPYQYRGQARRQLAASLEGKRQRKKLFEALADFDASVGKGNGASRKLREGVRDALWANLSGALAFDSWDPADSGLAGETRSLLVTPARIARAATWLDARMEEMGKRVPLIDGPKEELRNRQLRAARIVSWCDLVLTIARDLPGLRSGTAAARRLREKAQDVVAFKGYFRLAIQVYPHGVISSFLREGKEVSLKERTTPLRIPGRLRIGTFEIRLAHPGGEITKRIRIKPEQLEGDGVYVVTGNLEGKGDLQLRRLAP